MSGNSLEAERQAILDRMQARRERYRLMLMSGADLDDEAVVVEPHTATYPPRHSFAPDEAQPVSVPAYRQRFQAAPVSARHGTVVRVLMEHPFLVALGVAAVVAIGPRRIFRGVTRGGTVLSTMAVRNQSNVDMIGRIVTMLGAYMQGRTQR